MQIRAVLKPWHIANTAGGLHQRWAAALDKLNLTECGSAIIEGKMKTKAGFMERRGRLEELDRSFDVTFWQKQSPEARFAAAWELIVYASKVKGVDVRQLRLQRLAETFQRQRR